MAESVAAVSDQDAPNFAPKCVGADAFACSRAESKCVDADVFAALMNRTIRSKTSVFLTSYVEDSAKK